MAQVVAISLENEMDLILAHKRSMKVAEKLGLTIATQTTFATAVSEISRTVIEHTDNGNLEISLDYTDQRYVLRAVVSFDSAIKFTNADEGFYYAQKLVPEFKMTEADGLRHIEIKIKLPRSIHLDTGKIDVLKGYFLKELPLNAYEEIKKKNLNLYKIAGEQEEEIKRSKIIDDKKNEFISIASHELKTPITVIKAYTQIALTSKEPCSEKIKGYLDKIDYQTTKLTSLVNQLLDVSKMENGNLLYAMEKVELNLFIADMVLVMKHIIPSHEIVVNPCNKVNIKIDKLRMEQVFSNLLGNASKYSSMDTLITINCFLQDDRYVNISITDQGMGMSEGSMQSIFDKFYRDKDVLRTHSGLGMGLYIASKIVTDHGGRIWVESIEGIGSTFFFTIPYEIFKDQN